MAALNESTSATTSAPPRRDGWPSSGHVRIAIIGAGFGGLGTGHSLREAGITDFVILDRGTTVGGTWRDNTYPGCGCDVASHLYSFSFAPNPRWSRSYSRQAEILRYLEDVTRRFELERHLALEVEVHVARWDQPTARWQLSTSEGDLTADIVVGAAGPLSKPVTPHLPGLSEFPGPVFHSAAWRHDVDLAGKSIGVVGTGASAVQLIPEIQPRAAKVTIFQRTPPWLLPKGDRRITALEQAVYHRFPAVQRAVRASHFLLRESTIPAFVLQPALMALAEKVSRQQIKRQVHDPAIQAAVTPDYRLGCKRVLPSNNYYPTLNQPNVQLVPKALTSIEGSTGIASDGSRHELDVIIFGTGFQVADMPIGHQLIGRDGQSMNEAWQIDGTSALRSTTVAGFPNLFLILGPNSGLGHSSMVYVIESQTAYIVEAIRAMTAARLAAIEPRTDAQRKYNAILQRRMKRTVWTTGGCASWYQDANGKVTALWPGSTFRLRQNTRTVDLREYQLRPLDQKLAAARTNRTNPTNLAVGGAA